MNPIKKFVASAAAVLNGPRVIEAADNIIDTGRYGRFLPGPEVTRYLEAAAFAAMLREVSDALANMTIPRAEAATKLQAALEFLPIEQKSQPPCPHLGQRLGLPYGAVLKCIATNIEGTGPITLEVGLLADIVKQVEGAVSSHLTFAQRAPDANTVYEDHAAHSDNPKNRSAPGFDRNRAMGR